MSTEAKTFGVNGKPLDNVLAVGRKHLKCAQVDMTAWAWWVLVDHQDGTYSTHWFTTKRPFDKREMSDHYVGERVNLLANRKSTTIDQWESEAGYKGYTTIEDPEYWPIQCAPSPVIAEWSEA